MKQIIHLFTKLAVLASVLTIAGFFANESHADTLPDTVSFQLHKLAFDKGQLKEKSISNTGLEQVVDGKPLPGSEFTLIDVTANYADFEKTMSRAEAIAKIQTDFKGLTTAGTLPYGSRVNLAASGNVGEGYKNPAYTASNNGQLSFLNVPSKQGGKDAVYVIAETNSSLAVNNGLGEKAVPMVVTLPVYQPNTTATKTDIALSTIHLYPKNELVNVNTKKKETSGITFDKKTPIKYVLEFQVPAVASTKLEIHDAVKPKGALSLFTDTTHPFTVTIKDTNTVLSSDYFTQTEGVNSDLFSINFKEDKIKEVVGRTIRVEYYAVITESAPIDTAIQNIAYLITDSHDNPVDPEKPYDPTQPNQPIFPNLPTDPNTPFNPYEPSNPNDPNNPNPPVFTGGYKFIKSDSNNGKALAGATFVIQNDRNQYATFTDNGTFNGWVTDQTDATVITSASNGTFEVKGLNTGTYQLKEIQAPTGYALPSKPFEFNVLTGTKDVKKDTYSLGSEAAAFTVKNVKKGILPSTGAKGIYSFLAIGLVFFGAAFVVYKRSSKQSEV